MGNTWWAHVWMGANATSTRWQEDTKYMRILVGGVNRIHKIHENACEWCGGNTQDTQEFLWVA